MSEASQTPDQSGLKQIQTKRRERQYIDVDPSSHGWTPQAPPSKPFHSWWETPDRTD